MKRMKTAFLCRLLVVSGACLVLATVGNAQVQTSTGTSKGAASREVTVERGTVALVNGNDLYVRAEDGSIRHFANVPNSTKIDVDGNELSVHDLKPGMKLQRTITTTTRPEMVTTVSTVTGKVWHVSPPSSVILTLEDGTNQEFKIPNNQKFNIEGSMVDAWGLKKGMQVSATKVVEAPVTSVSETRNVTGEMPPPPPADAPILIVHTRPAPAPQTAVAEEPAPQQLPKTGSELPLIGLLGLAFVGLSFGIRRFSQS
jgi:LPXTG-motif cell wall-anchored protein